MTEIHTGGGLVIQVDEDTAEFLQGRPWWLWKSRGRLYVQFHWEGKKCLLHRWVMQAPPGLLVHHEDDDGLNNRRSNLVLLTRSEHSRLHAPTDGPPASTRRPRRPRPVYVYPERFRG